MLTSIRSTTDRDRHRPSPRHGGAKPLFCVRRRRQPRRPRHFSYANFFADNEHALLRAARTHSRAAVLLPIDVLHVPRDPMSWTLARRGRAEEPGPARLPLLFPADRRADHPLPRPDPRARRMSGSRFARRAPFRPVREEGAGPSNIAPPGRTFAMPAAQLARTRVARHHLLHAADLPRFRATGHGDRPRADVRFRFENSGGLTSRHGVDFGAAGTSARRGSGTTWYVPLGGTACRRHGGIGTSSPSFSLACGTAPAGTSSSGVCSTDRFVAERVGSVTPSSAFRPPRTC